MGIIGQNCQLVSHVMLQEDDGNEPLDIEFLLGLEELLSEWDSENDDEAYRDL